MLHSLYQANPKPERTLGLRRKPTGLLTAQWSKVFSDESKFSILLRNQVS